MATKMAAVGYQNRTFTRLTWDDKSRHFLTIFSVINLFMGLFMSFKVNKRVNTMLNVSNTYNTFTPDLSREK